MTISNKDNFQNKSEMGRHRSEKENLYFLKRDELLERESLDKNFIVQNPFLFSDRITIEKMLIRTELFKMSLNITGSIVECGVANGNSLMLYAYLSSILESTSFTRKIVGFDSFEDGFVDVTPELDNVKEGELGTSYETLKLAVELFNVDRRMQQFDKVQLIKGNANETIPKYIKTHPEFIISFLYLDFDIYKPTKLALELLLPLVPKGGIVAFDELNYENFPGETLALKEVVKLNSIKLHKFSFSPLVSYFIVGE